MLVFLVQTESGELPYLSNRTEAVLSGGGAAGRSRAFEARTEKQQG
jgi:hypothetical protein